MIKTSYRTGFKWLTCTWINDFWLTLHQKQTCKLKKPKWKSTKVNISKNPRKKRSHVSIVARKDTPEASAELKKESWNFDHQWLFLNVPALTAMDLKFSVRAWDRQPSASKKKNKITHIYASALFTCPFFKYCKTDVFNKISIYPEKISFYLKMVLKSRVFGLKFKTQGLLTSLRVSDGSQLALPRPQGRKGMLLGSLTDPQFLNQNKRCLPYPLVVLSIHSSRYTVRHIINFTTLWSSLHTKPYVRSFNVPL